MKTLLLLSVWLVSASAQAQPRSPQSRPGVRAFNSGAERLGLRASAPTTVRGTVFDSLNKMPLAGATVWIDGNVETAISDAFGRFSLATIEPGKRFISFTSPTLDSIGVGTLSKAILVEPDGTTSVALAVPSFSALWRSLCAGARVVNADSGIVWGTVRDAATDARYHGARTVMQWPEPQVNARKEIIMTPMVRVAKTDSVGTYVVCGLPTQTNMFIEADAPKSASGVLRRAIGTNRIVRVDILVSPEMDVPKVASRPGASSEEAVIPIRAHGTSTLRGTVRDDQQRPLANVSINSSATDSTVVTNSEGIFTISDLPAGTHFVEARRIGATPSTATVDLRPGASAEISLTLKPITELAKVDVNAKAGSSRDREDFDARRKLGFGYALTEEKLKDQTDIATALRNLPSLTVRRGGTSILLSPPPSAMGSCPMRVWIDGMQMSMRDIDQLQPSELKAVEWYPNFSSAPIAYSGSLSCSVIMFWTNRSRWAGESPENKKGPNQKIRAFARGATSAAVTPPPLPS